MALDCFFAVWFVVGNVWIFGGHSSAEEAPNLYRYCHVVFITPFLPGIRESSPSFLHPFTLQVMYSVSYI
jgi:hypothetical protein